VQPVINLVVERKIHRARRHRMRRVAEAQRPVPADGGEEAGVLIGGAGSLVGKDV
jgi:hypothetical protein